MRGAAFAVRTAPAVSEAKDTSYGTLRRIRSVLRFLFRYAGRYWPSYLFGFAALFATNWAVVRIPTVVGEILNILERTGVGDEAIDPAALAEASAAALAPVSELALELMPGGDAVARLLDGADHVQAMLYKLSR